MLVQLLAPYTYPERHNAQRDRQTDGRTDDMMMPIADHSVQQYDRLKTADGPYVDLPTGFSQ